MKNKKQAFTLAEVLLVLAIIGVIAAVTIPAIMQQSSEKKFSALAKKAQSTLQNAIVLKIATVPIGPGDMRVNMLAWLLHGEEDGTNTLKATKANADSTIIQVPDGMIYYINYGQNCITESTPTNRIGCETRIFVDLNGSEGPTKTTVEDATTTLWNSKDDKKAYDTISLWVNYNTRVKPNNSYTVIKNRTIKYLGIVD